MNWMQVFGSNRPDCPCKPIILKELGHDLDQGTPSKLFHWCFTKTSYRNNVFHVHGLNSVRQVLCHAKWFTFETLGVSLVEQSALGEVRDMGIVLIESYRDRPDQLLP